MFLESNDSTGWDVGLTRRTELVSASRDETVFSVKVAQDMCNALGSMHGGTEIQSRMWTRALDMLTSYLQAPWRPRSICSRYVGTPHASLAEG